SPAERSRLLAGNLLLESRRILFHSCRAHTRDSLRIMIASPAPPISSPKLLDRVRWHLRLKHYSLRTEQAYVDWIRRFILFHRKRHPDEMGEKEIAAFLTHLAVNLHVAASTQNQALSALLFLYQQLLERKLDFLGNVVRVKRPPTIPV